MIPTGASVSKYSPSAPLSQIEVKCFQAVGLFAIGISTVLESMNALLSDRTRLPVTWPDTTLYQKVATAQVSGWKFCAMPLPMYALSHLPPSVLTRIRGRNVV